MRGCIWINSDLQLSRADLAREVLQNAVEDMIDLQLPLHEIWCLGDALVGADLAALEEVAKSSVDIYERLNVPVCYVMGNHETDLFRRSGARRFPLFELVQNRDNWYTMASLSDFYFTRDVLDHRVFFLGDHVAEDGSWISVVGRISGKADHYPHFPGGFEKLRDQIDASPLPVIIASHYAFEGGQRPNKKQSALLPLPENVRAHFHGHAHIGDLVWNLQNPWKRKNPIARSAISQFNVSALETARTPGSHSAVLFFEADGSIHVKFRCHMEKKWIEQHDIT